IEHAIHGWQVGTIHHSVESSPPIKWRPRYLDTVSANRVVEPAAGGKKGVPHLLEVEPPAIHSPHEAIVWVELTIFGVILIVLLIRVGEQDQSVQLLERPAVLDEVRGKPVQQLGVRRSLAARAEVTGCAHDSLAEVTQPDAIDHHACG